MKLRISKTLKFWVDVACEQRKLQNPNKSKQALIAKVLHEWEEVGEAMRYLGPTEKLAGQLHRECSIGWPMPNAMRKMSWTNGRDASGDFGPSLKTLFSTRAFAMQTLLLADNRRPKPEPIPYSTTALRKTSPEFGAPGQSSQRRRRRDAIYTYLSAVYELVTWWAAEGRDVERARRALWSRRLDVPEREDPFAAIIRCTADPARVDKRTRSKWSRVMRYVTAVKDQAEPFQQFVQRKGGINRCASRFTRLLKRQRKPPPRRAENC